MIGLKTKSKIKSTNWNIYFWKTSRKCMIFNFRCTMIRYWNWIKRGWRRQKILWR